MGDALFSNLVSGFFGSFLTIVCTFVAGCMRRKKEQTNLYRAIVSECRYNLSILDEITHGTINANGSFKRMSVEFFKTIRQQAISNSLSKDLLQELSRVIVDLELFNMEADFVFNENLAQCMYIGDFNKTPICVVKKMMHHDICETVKAANSGVRGSLTAVLDVVLKELKEEDKES